MAKPLHLRLAINANLMRKNNTVTHPQRYHPGVMPNTQNTLTSRQYIVPHQTIQSIEQPDRLVAAREKAHLSKFYRGPVGRKQYKLTKCVDPDRPTEHS